MFVLFSYGAVKHGDGRNHFSEKKTKQNPKKRRLLFWKASESPLVPTKGSECGLTMADWRQRRSHEFLQRKKWGAGGGEALLVNSIFTIR